MPTANDTAPPGHRAQASSRDRIVASGLELFSARGYNGVSMSDIAHACGVTKAALYYHFADKESLFLEALRTRTERLGAELGRLIASPEPIEPVLRRIAEFLLDDGLSDYRQMQSDLLTSISEGRRGEQLAASRAVGERLLPRLEAEQRDGTIDASIDLTIALPLFFSMIGGQLRRHALAPSGEPLPHTNEEIASIIVHIWLHGVEPASTGEIA